MFHVPQDSPRSDLRNVFIRARTIAATERRTPPDTTTRHRTLRTFAAPLFRSAPPGNTLRQRSDRPGSPQTNRNGTPRSYPRSVRAYRFSFASAAPGRQVEPAPPPAVRHRQQKAEEPKPLRFAAWLRRSATRPVYFHTGLTGESRTNSSTTALRPGFEAV